MAWRRALLLPVALTVGAGAMAQPRPATTLPALESLIEADRYREAEAPLRRLVPAPGIPLTIDTALAGDLLARALIEMGRIAEAEALLTRVVTFRRAAGDARLTARTLRSLSGALVARNANAEGETVAREAIALAVNAPGDKSVLASAYTALGTALSLQRRYPESEAAFREALSLARVALGDAHPITQAAFSNLAVVLGDQGLYPESEALFRRALETYQLAKPPNQSGIAHMSLRLAEILSKQRRHDEAEPLTRAALAIYAKGAGRDKSRAFNAQELLANILTARGNLGEAERTARGLATGRATAVDTSLFDQVADQGRIGHIILMDKRPGEAVPFFEKAVAMARDKLGPRDPLLTLGMTELAVAQLQADPASEAAWRTIQDSLAILTSRQVREAGGDPTQFRTALGVAMTMARIRGLQNPAQADAMRAASFRFAQELTRSAAAKAMAQTRARQAAGGGALGRAIAEQQRLSERATALRKELIAAITGDPAREAALRREQEAVATALTKSEADLKTRFPDYDRLIDPDPIGEDDVRARLKPGEGLLLIIDDGARIASYGVSTRGAATAQSRATSQEVMRMVAKLRCEMDEAACPQGVGQSADYDQATAFALFRELVSGVLPALEGVDRLYVVTSGQLSGLPLAALTTGPGADAEWLGDQVALVTLPSVAMLKQRGDRPTPPARMSFAGYGAPLLGAPGVPRGGAGAKLTVASAPGQVRADPAVLKQMVSLPGTKTELDALASLFGRQSEVRTGAAATEQAFRADPEVARASVLALATHGVLPREVAGIAEPGLVLTPPDAATAENDGLLTASEAASMRLTADLVILSACNTATGEGAVGGEGLSALARAFIFAGSDALLASHWRVSDAATAALTVETVRAWRKGRSSKADALREGMRAVRTGKRGDGSKLEGWSAEWSHPSAWAAFSLISDRAD